MGEILKILLLHPGALGDIILSLAALGVFRRQIPGAQITLAGNLDYLRAVAKGYADQIVSLATLRLHRLYMPGLLSADEAQLWKSYDRIVSWTGFGHDQFTKNLMGANSEVCIASWKPELAERRHLSRIFADSLGFWFPESVELPPAPISLSEMDRRWGQMWLREQGWTSSERLVAMHPGAGSSKKRWPEIRFQELAHEIVSGFARKLLIVEGPAEEGLARKVARDLPKDRVYLADSLGLEELAAVLAQCSAFVGNDSGIAHLAGGLNVPSLVLFGPTAPEHWAPRGERVLVLRDTRGCHACETAADSGHICLENITVEMCSSALGTLIGAASSSPIPDPYVPLGDNNKESGEVLQAN